MSNKLPKTEKVVRRMSDLAVYITMLFSIYVEAMLEEALDDLEDGIRVEGELVNTIRFPDDNALMHSTGNRLRE